MGEIEVVIDEHGAWPETFFCLEKRRVCQKISIPLDGLLIFEFCLKAYPTPIE
jgi:hypothetical protein